METGREKPSGPARYFEQVQGQRKFRPNYLANEIEEQYEFVYVEETEKFYVYLENYWQDKAERIIREECNDRLVKEFEPARASRVVDTIKTRSYISKHKKDFQPCKYKIPFLNGAYNLETGELEEHSPDDRFTHIIPWTYDPEAECPRIKQFLEEVVENEVDKEKILETIGYSLLADYPYAHALILYGSGRNGKSVLLKLWKKVLSENNYKEEQLQQLESGRFATQSLYRKLAVFNDDLPNTKLETGSTLKSLTGGNEVRAEIKGGEHFEFKNFATPVFACNEIPESNDSTDGFYRRWEIINFPYKFVENPVKENHKQQKSKKELMEELTQDSEIMGLLNEAVSRLEKMKEQGGFTYKTDAEATRTLWKSYSNPLDQFIEICLEQGMTQQDVRELEEDPHQNNISDYQYDFIAKDDLVFLINKYCEHFSSKAPSKTKITRKLKNDSPYYVQEGRTRQMGEDDDRTRVYKFIQFSDEFRDFVFDDNPRPDCPYFFENLRVCARDVLRNYENTQDTKDTLNLGHRIKDYIDEHEDTLVEEQDIIDNLDVDQGKVDKKISELIHDGELYRPKPGVVQTI
ncbi:phage/plasmid primase, P4 family, C-terminal domain-containing protein [Haloarcula vallismortis]|uniref:Phage/plasmid primase, P4 family protein n=2 Tax=Haloarcula vallismortis TaxID=28442 RepID=M0JVD0_HALVA|nr:phage/plasmid primase, P4 family [Haloarcula vallismortis]EMA11600.1 phage/plasmid primase, P4 family protein [Haloarcula vallismortis ATCC 29715]SDW45941.1 phage/plasmid primase, P4 family, C-terminal domain-containing protein [Haloarcula vallismortis]